MERTEAAVYKSLERIRTALHRCITRKMSGETPS
jgi:hypothetical protein